MWCTKYLTKYTYYPLGFSEKEIRSKIFCARNNAVQAIIRVKALFQTSEGYFFVQKRDYCCSTRSH